MSLRCLGDAQEVKCYNCPQDSLTPVDRLHIHVHENVLNAVVKKLWNDTKVYEPF